MIENAIAVAVSGGIDSMVLLHETVVKNKDKNIEIVAININHGLNPDYSLACEQLIKEYCSDLYLKYNKSVKVVTYKLPEIPTKGQSVEAWARTQRYFHLSRLAGENYCQSVLLAHHQNDQVETVLIQLLRSGGCANLAAMGAISYKFGCIFERPWLNKTKKQIVEDQLFYNIPYIDDPSNTDTKFTRNKVRTHLMPVLEHEFDNAYTAICNSASKMNLENVFLMEVSEQILKTVSDNESNIYINLWCELSEIQRWGTLTTWLRNHYKYGPQTSLLERLLKELPKCVKREQTWQFKGQTLTCRSGKLLVSRNI